MTHRRSKTRDDSTEGGTCIFPITFKLMLQRCHLWQLVRCLVLCTMDIGNVTLMLVNIHSSNYIIIAALVLGCCLFFIGWISARAWSMLYITATPQVPVHY